MRFLPIGPVSRLILCAAALHAMIPATSAQEFRSLEKQAVLVELYSSEGCSSCPPAEERMSQWKASPGLWREFVPVGFHVDYWDQLGWPDRFAKPEYTQRQRDYAARLGQDSIYTPEFILNGQEWRNWYLRADAPGGSGAATGVLNVKVAGSHVAAAFSGATGTAYQLKIALLGSGLVSKVVRGENEGHTLRHDFVALSFASIPMTVENGVAHASGQIPTPTTSDKPAAIAAWVVSDDGAFVQATGGWLASDKRVSLENGPH
jgi:hypothetical protein